MKKITLSLGILLSILTLASCQESLEPFTFKSYTSQETILSLTVDLNNREVRIVQADDLYVHIDYLENSKEFYTFDLQETNLTMNLNYNKSFTDYFGTQPSLENRIVTIYVPTSLESLNLKTTNENINIDNIKIKNDINLYVNGGNLSFESLDCDDSITLESKNGNINGNIVGSYDDFKIETNIKKGETNLPSSKLDGDKSLLVKANNGDITINFKK